MEHISKRLISWASILDDQTRAQATLASTMPFIFPHIALMPDAHLGKGATVGSVIPIRISPTWWKARPNSITTLPSCGGHRCSPY
ncbi:hypothetical protein JOE66_002813 [Subtercola frigoramans]|uniref:3'-phosphate/5'-hydroxy nucleic acid ligase n=1 Tax=Subtercola frigoramans TaxID=120298 RepID=A0ABS2L869_9MICO|nr:hypothetical protein [Subtercola frigoramans]